MIIVDKARWRMGVYEDKKEVLIQILAFVRDEMVAEYLEDIIFVSKNLQKSHYTLVVDATHQTPLARKAASEIGETMFSYTTLGFKHVIIVAPKSKIAFVQVRNGIQRVNFPGDFVMKR